MLVMPPETTRQVHEQEWGQLIARTAQGNQVALATLYDRPALKSTGVPSRFSIIVKQQKKRRWTFTPKSGARPIYDETRGSPGGWLMTLARTRAIDCYHAGAAERGRIESLDAVEFFASDGETPEQDLAGAECRRYVQQAVILLTAE